MIRRLTVAAVLLLTAAPVQAHRVDVLLQAARVAVSPTGMIVHIGVTPGISVAPEIIGQLDRDADGRISPVEAETYGRRVLADVSATLDAAPLSLTLRRVDAPPTAEIRDGEGTVRIEATADFANRAAGRHRIILSNAHRPDLSVYLANALLPDDAAIRILRQTRDPRQQIFTLDYEVEQTVNTRVAWLLAAALLTLLAYFRGRPSL